MLWCVRTDTREGVEPVRTSLHKIAKKFTFFVVLKMSALP